MMRILPKICSAWQHALSVLLVCLFVGCEPPGKPNPADKPRLPDQLLNFEKLFSQNCAGCHGAEGKWGPAPPLNDPLFAAIISPEELTRTIRWGRTGTPMPAFARENGGALTDQQIEVLVTGIGSHWKGETPLPANLPAYALDANGGFSISDELIQRGSGLFAKNCATCHGTNGAGISMDGVLKNAIHVPAFLSLISNQALRRIIITGRPDLGMPNFSEDQGRHADFQPLTSAEINDLVSLLASWRGHEEPGDSHEQ